MNAWKWAAIALGAWCALSIPAALATGWFFNRIKHPPRANPPAAGTSPVPGPSRQGGVPTPRATSAPAPAITEHEADALNAIQRLTQHAQPGQLLAGREIADGLRLRIPAVDDWTLGVVVIDLVGYLKALYLGLPDPDAAMRCAMDAFGLAAEHLTRLERNEVPS